MPDVSGLTLSLTTQPGEVRRVTPRLHKLENDNDLRGAAKELMLAIKRSEEPEKWKMFFGALRQDGASLILDTLLEEKEGDLWHTERRNLIDVFKKDLQEALDLERILPAALDKELIHKEDADNLKTMIKDGSHARAIGTFLIILHRRKTEWYKDFLTILYDHNYKGLAETIEPGFGKKLLEQRAHTEQEEMKRVDREAAASRRGGGESRQADPRPAAEGEGGLHDSLDQVSIRTSETGMQRVQVTENTNRFKAHIEASRCTSETGGIRRGRVDLLMRLQVLHPSDD
nr:hypothetical protein BaRGS_025163 [Batillaria attramentaria]